MAYTAATQLPSLVYFQWSRPDAPNPRLAAPISATQTTITLTNPPLDYTDAVITGNFLMGIRNAEGYVESIYVPAGKVSADGLTLTDVVRGIRLNALDYTTGLAALAIAFDQDSAVTCQISGVNFELLLSAMKGTIASGGTSWKIGAGADDDITVYAYNADVNKPYFRYDKATSAWIYSDDGVSSSPFGTGAGLTAGDGIDITGGVVKVVLGTNKGLEFATGLLQAKVNSPITVGASGIGFDATANLTLSGTIDLSGTFKVGGAAVTSSAAELNKLDGASANVTATNLNTLTAGVTTDADALHTHASIIVASNNLKVSCDTERSYRNGYSAYTLLKAISVQKTGVYRVVYESKVGSVSYPGHARVYKNGVAYGTDNSVTSATYSTYTQDLFFYAGDSCELVATNATTGAYTYVQNFRLYFDFVAPSYGDITIDR